MYWTSLNKINSSVFSWLGGAVNHLIDTSNLTAGDCVALNGTALRGNSCDTKLAYICEANPPV